MTNKTRLENTTTLRAEDNTEHRSGQRGERGNSSKRIGSNNREKRKRRERPVRWATLSGKKR